MDVQAIDQGQAVQASTASGALPAFPAPDSPGQRPAGTAVKADETLNRALSTLAGGGANVSVSFQVLENPNEIITVFKNVDTGEVITQFPTETMVVLAQFFNKLAGAVLDRTA
jgi:uncharacterized FlaG/YvyC family protein